MINYEVFRDKQIIAANENVREREFWTKKLEGRVDRHVFPFDSSINSGKRAGLEVSKFNISGKIFDEIMAQCGGSEYKLHVVLMTVLILLLKRYSYSEEPDIVIGTPIYRPDVDGELVNTILPIRVQFDINLTFREMLRLVGRTTKEAIENQSYPVEILFERLNLKLTDTPFSFLDVVLLLRNIHDREAVDNITPNIKFIFNRKDAVLEGEVEYNSSLYENQTISRIIKHYTHLLSRAILDTNSRISDFDILSSEEKNQILLDFNKKRSDRNLAGDKEIEAKCFIHELFESQAAKNQDILAVGYEDRYLSYSELNKRANQLARLLKSKGAAEGNVIALICAPSIEGLIGIMAILKRGAIYLPLAEDYPEELKKEIIKENKVEFVLPQQYLQKATPALSLDSSNLNIELKFNKSACIIYTAGSAGKPKGVLLKHSNVVNLVKGLKETVYSKYSVRINVGSVVHFMSSISLMQIFGVLLQGYSLSIFPNASKFSVEELLRFYQDKKIDISDTTPHHLLLLMKSNNGNINKIYVGHFISSGDVLSQKLLERFLNRFSTEEPIITNIYGTVEGGIASTSYKISKGNIGKYDHIPIGRPLPDVRVYILGRNNELQPIGAPGELCVAGEGVSDGYVNKKGLTDERFIANPFNLREKMYKTGDLARWLPDGSLEFIRKTDLEININGKALQPGEIEYQLQKCDGFLENVVTVNQHDENGNSLQAYIISDKDIEEPTIKKYLAGRLIGYKIPGRFVRLERFPVNLNFKIDRELLLKNELEFLKKISQPETPTEEKLLEMWAEVLEVEKGTIGMDTNFFEINGNSLKTIMLISRIFKELNVRVSLGEFFELPTIKKLARHIDKENRVDPFFLIKPTEEKEYYGLSSAQKRIYFMQQADPESIAYNFPNLEVLGADLNKERLNQAFRKVIMRHQSLRTSFMIIDNEPVQRIHKEVDFEIAYYDGAEREIKDILGHFVKPFDLSIPPLLRLGMVTLEEKKHLLMLDIHHIITDNISLNLTCDDIIGFYNGREPSPLKLQYKDYSEWQNEMQLTGMFRDQERFWLKEFENEVEILNIYTDFERPSVQSLEGSAIRFRLGNEDTKALNKLAQEEEVTLFMLLLSIYTVLLSKLSFQEDIVIGTVTAGRGHIDLESIVGLFANTLALRLYPKSEKGFVDFLKDVKTATLNAFENQHYQFDDLVKKLPITRDMSRNPLFDVGFALNNINKESTDLREKRKMSEYRDYEFEHRISKVDLSLYCIEGAENLFFTFEYCTKLFTEKTIKEFTRYLKEIIEAVKENKSIKLADIMISSNFMESDSVNPEMEFDF
jgi:amino acid adenylation domain-containing protein